MERQDRPGLTNWRDTNPMLLELDRTPHTIYNVVCEAHFVCFVVVDTDIWGATTKMWHPQSVYMSRGYYEVWTEKFN